MKLVAGIAVVCFVLLSTTETFYLRSRTPLNQEDYEPILRKSYRVRSPQLGRIRTRLLQLAELPTDPEENQVSEGGPSVVKRIHYQDQGVVFPWNEWKCQVRGCRR